MFPENIVQATFQQVQTNYIAVKPRLLLRTFPANMTNSSSLMATLTLNETAKTFLTTNSNLSTVRFVGTNVSMKPVMKPILEYTNEVNVLGLIVFCTGFGVILGILGEQARLMINFFIVLDAVIMKWISALMWYVY